MTDANSEPRLPLAQSMIDARTNRRNRRRNTLSRLWRRSPIAIGLGFLWFCSRRS